MLINIAKSHNSRQKDAYLRLRANGVAISRSRIRAV